MPHVVVKLVSGRTDQQKRKLAEGITKAVIEGAGVGAESVSVAIEDVAHGDWTEQVYKPDILGKPDTIFKPPGYKPS